MFASASANASYSEAYDRYMNVRHFGSLDGLRFICIMMVLWHHAPLSGPAREWHTIFGRGFVGVDFFFVLSGFLITTLLLREEARKGAFSLRGFYWRRALRILPVYLAVVSVVGFYVVVVQGQYDKAALLPYYFLFLSNFLNEHLITLEPTWSLSVEEQYYLIWPALLLLAPRRWILPILAVLVAFNVIAVTGALDRFGIRPYAANEAITIWFPSATYAPILMGSAVAILLNTRAVFEALAPLLATRVAPVLGLLGVFAALWLLPGDLRGWPNFVLHSAMCVALMTLVMREDHLMHAPLNQGFIVRSGQISYGLYLYHQFGLYLAIKGLEALGLASNLTLTVTYIAVSYVIAEISFRTLERYFQGLR